MTWDRGSIPDYDAWETLGNSGWNWESFRAAMLKVENFQDTQQDRTLYGLKGVGHDGPIQTLINRHIFSPQEGFIPAQESLEIKQLKHRYDALQYSTKPHWALKSWHHHCCQAYHLSCPGA
jgi:choline dehydrogenase-like flavoprotein